MIYVDTSVLGAIFFREPQAARVLDRLQHASGAGLGISAWTLTEMASVGAIKVRTGAIDQETRRLALSAFQRFVSSNLHMSEIEPADFRSAAQLIEGPRPLRAGDALHLAIAKRRSATLATLDRRLAEAADTAGIAVLTLG